MAVHNHLFTPSYLQPAAAVILPGNMSKAEATSEFLDFHSQQVEKRVWKNDLYAVAAWIIPIAGIALTILGTVGVGLSGGPLVIVLLGCIAVASIGLTTSIVLPILMVERRKFAYMERSWNRSKKNEFDQLVASQFIVFLTERRTKYIAECRAVVAKHVTTAAPLQDLIEAYL